MGNIQPVEVVGGGGGVLGRDRLLRVLAQSAEMVNAGGSLMSEVGV